MNLFLIRENLRMAAGALVANRLRSFLALLGIVSGVGTVIGMVALINGFQRSFEQSIQSIGNNTIYIRRIRPGIQINGQIPDSLKQRRAFTMDDASAILAQPYQPDYVPTGTDSAFGAAGVLDTAPAEDYTTGSIPGSPDAPAWPPWFTPVSFTSGDGAPLFGELAVHSGTTPGVVVVHGFNTHGYASVIRWATMLYANGYDVLAADQRDYSFEFSAGVGYPAWQQTFGWKESQDVLAAGR